jgi:hypothetical protein
MPGLSTGFMARHPRFIGHSIHATCPAPCVLGRVLSWPRGCVGYKRNVRKNCALGSRHLIPLGETPDYFHYSVLAMNHGLKLSDEKYEDS